MNYLKRDILTLTAINLVYLVGLLTLYRINQNNQAVETTIARWLGF